DDQRIDRCRSRSPGAPIRGRVVTLQPRAEQEEITISGVSGAKAAAEAWARARIKARIKAEEAASGREVSESRARATFSALFKAEAAKLLSTQSELEALAPDKVTASALQGAKLQVEAQARAAIITRFRAEAALVPAPNVNATRAKAKAQNKGVVRAAGAEVKAVAPESTDAEPK
ncbi:unnamed protein product, partial [Polarella glacialis]